MKRLNAATHKEVSEMALGSVQLIWSRHAEERASAKRVKHSERLVVSKGQIVEIELLGSTVSKVVARVSGLLDLDYVYVLVPQTANQWKVVTVWTNHVNDNHSTLNLRRIS